MAGTISTCLSSHSERLLIRIVGSQYTGFSYGKNDRLSNRSLNE